MENGINLNKPLDDGLKSGGVLLISFKSKDYRENLKSLTKILTKRFKKICYVSLNEPSDNIMSSLSLNGGSNIFFIDCVTSMVKQAEPRENVTFVSSPHALTEISINLKKSLEKKMDFVLFDSISTMLIYENPLTVLKFIHNMILTLRANKICGAFIILKEDVCNELLKDINMLIDRNLEI